MTFTQKYKKKRLLKKTHKRMQRGGVLPLNALRMGANVLGTGINAANNIGTGINAATNAFGSDIENMKDTFGTGVNAMSSATNALGSTASNAFRSGMDKITNATGMFANNPDCPGLSCKTVKNFLNTYDPMPIIPDEGILEIIKSFAMKMATGPPIMAAEMLLRMAGLEFIGSDSNSFIQSLSQNQNIASKIALSVFNLVDSKFGCILNKLDNFLNSDQAKATIEESINNLVTTFTRLLKEFNTTLQDPMMKEEFVVAVFVLGEYTKILALAMKQPIDNVTDLLNNAIVNALGGVSSGIIKVVTDTIGAVPFIGPFVDIGKALNDGSKAALSVFNAGISTIEAGSVLVGETGDNIKQEIEKLKNQGQTINSRINDSMNQFEKPIKDMQQTVNNAVQQPEQQMRNRKQMGGRPKKRNFLTKRTHHR